MDISKLAEQEKSIMLAKAMGLTIYYEFRHDPYRRVTVVIIGAYHVNSDIYKQLFYDETAMHYAKKVISWGYGNVPDYHIYLRKYSFALLMDDDGFSKALDYLLEAALAAGLVPLPDTEDSDK